MKIIHIFNFFDNRQTVFLCVCVKVCAIWRHFHDFFFFSLIFVISLCRLFVLFVDLAKVNFSLFFADFSLGAIINWQMEIHTSLHKFRWTKTKWLNFIHFFFLVFLFWKIILLYVSRMVYVCKHFPLYFRLKTIKIEIQIKMGWFNIWFSISYANL